MKRRGFYILGLVVILSCLTFTLLAGNELKTVYDDLQEKADDGRHEKANKSEDTLKTSFNKAHRKTNKSSEIFSPLSHLEFILSVTVLTFGLLTMLLELYLISSNKINPEDTIKFIVITLVITSTLFLITAGYTNDQIAPALGLLGTIAGYLLGKHQNQQLDKNGKSS